MERDGQEKEKRLVRGSSETGVVNLSSRRTGARSDSRACRGIHPNHPQPRSGDGRVPADHSESSFETRLVNSPTLGISHREPGSGGCTGDESLSDRAGCCKSGDDDCQKGTS